MHVGIVQRLQVGIAHLHVAQALRQPAQQHIALGRGTRRDADARRQHGHADTERHRRITDPQRLGLDRNIGFQSVQQRELEQVVAGEVELAAAIRGVVGEQSDDMISIVER